VNVATTTALNLDDATADDRRAGGYTDRRQSDEARSITAVDPLMASIPVNRRRMETA
jgi:hypothetical protein